LLAYMLVQENVPTNTEALEVLGCPISEVISSIGTLPGNYCTDRQKQNTFSSAEIQKLNL